MRRGNTNWGMIVWLKLNLHFGWWSSDINDGINKERMWDIVTFYPLSVK